MIFKIMHGCTCNREWRNRDLSAFLDLKGSNTAKFRNALILLANGLLRKTHFDVAGLFSKRGCRYRFASTSINGAEQADGEGAGRPKSSASRDVGEADNFKWTRGTDVVFIREGLVDADVNVFVDGGRNKKLPNFS
jgi:hypothetical protein